MLQFLPFELYRCVWELIDWSRLSGTPNLLCIRGGWLITTIFFRLVLMPKALLSTAKWLKITWAPPTDVVTNATTSGKYRKLQMVKHNKHSLFVKFNNICLNNDCWPNALNISEWEIQRERKRKSDVLYFAVLPKMSINFNL